MALAKPTVSSPTAVDTRRSDAPKGTTTSSGSESRAMVAIKDILSGTMGGFAQVAAGHPLDTIKVRLATAPGSYGGLVDCGVRTFRQEGMRGLYKGAASPLAGAVFHNACLFFAYGQARVWLGATSDDAQLSIGRTFVAGGIAGFLVSSVECPIDLLKIRLQAQTKPTTTATASSATATATEGGEAAYRGVWDAARRIYGEYGVRRGLYRGFTATALRNTPAFASYFAMFEAAKRALASPADTEGPSASTCLLAGGLSGFAFWGVLYPLDAIKTKIQNDAMQPSRRQYTGIVDCARKVLQQEGHIGLWRGYTPAILRAVPVNAFIFLAVTMTKRQLSKPKRET